jgi:putative spermidine/putrescine transport system ATP-binding protein
MVDVELKAVTKQYGDFTAVSGLSLQIEKGEFIALLGPSGCGKTTTLQMLAGFVEPSSGDILVRSRSVRGLPPHKRNIGVVFQSYALFPHLSVLENVAFGLKMRHVPVAEITERVGHALDLVQLSSLDQRYPKQLSGGQQQRVALARALVIEPSVLLLDEPLSNLDANLREQMRFEIREIQQRIGITTVFVTHDQGEAIAAADRLVVMEKGRVRQVGTPRMVYEKPADLFVAGFIGQSNLIRGRVGDIRGHETLVETDCGKVAVRTETPFRLGEHAVLALRPEDLRVAPYACPEHNSLAGRVTRVSYLGAAVNVGVRVGEFAVSVLMPREESAAEVDAPVFVTWPASKGILLPERSHD